MDGPFNCLIKRMSLKPRLQNVHYQRELKETEGYKKRENTEEKNEQTLESLDNK